LSRPKENSAKQSRQRRNAITSGLGNQTCNLNFIIVFDGSPLALCKIKFQYISFSLLVHLGCLGVLSLLALYLVHDFLSEQNNRLFLFLSELMDLFVAGRDQLAADQPNNLDEGHPLL
jgi:hypothetical protein